MSDKEPIFCSLAFGSASINSYGEYIPCCSIRTNDWEGYRETNPAMLELEPKDRINAPNLIEVRKTLLQGEWPKACENCKLAENAGVNSMRTIWNTGLTEYTIPAAEIVDPNDIVYLDLTFSTKCNSKCMTCNSDLSDFWEEEEAYIWNENKPKKNRVCIKDETAVKLAAQFPNVKRINFVGGEPTISDEHVQFLQSIVESGKGKDIAVGYVTNLAGINTKLIELWNNFREINISVSIDGFDKVNDYIRYPIKWEKTDTNLKRYLQLMVNNPERYMFGLSCTVSMFNAIQSVDLLEYWIDVVTDLGLNPHVGIFLNRVSYPDWLTVNFLSHEYRQAGIDKAQQLLEKIELYNNTHDVPINSGSKDSVELLISWLQEPQIHDPVLLSKCKNFIISSDRFRKRHLKDYIPELWEELEKLWNSLT